MHKVNKILKLLKPIIVLGALLLIFSCQEEPERPKGIIQNQADNLSGANWIKVGEDELGKATGYIDVNSIIKTEEGYVRFWEKAVFNLEDSSDKDYRVIGYSEVDCKKKRRRFLQATGYYADGTTEKESVPSEWGSLLPGAYGELIYKFICQNDRK
jgi:hypothetical protein